MSACPSCAALGHTCPACSAALQPQAHAISIRHYPATDEAPSSCIAECHCDWTALPTIGLPFLSPEATDQQRQRGRDHLRWVRAMELGRQCVTCHGTGDRSGSPDLACRDCLGTGIAPDHQEEK